jgi:hypothetical protein
MQRKARIALGALAAACVALVCAVHGFQAETDTTAQAVFGIGVALSAAATLGPSVWLIYLAIQGTPDDLREAAAYKFRWMLATLASLVLVADALVIFDGNRPSAESIAFGARLKPIHVLGAVALLIIFYFRFRWLRIYADSGRSAAVRKKFERFEIALVRIVWGLIVLQDVSREFFDGFRQRAAFVVLGVTTIVSIGHLLQTWRKRRVIPSPTFD